MYEVKVESEVIKKSGQSVKKTRRQEKWKT